MTRLNVDRMRRHQRRDAAPRRPLTTEEGLEQLRRTLAATGTSIAALGHGPRWGAGVHPSGCLKLITGPWPLGPDVDEPIKLTTRGRDRLLQLQVQLGLTVDGVLGPQSWLAIADRNARNHR